jgi:hypothetical protein
MMKAETFMICPGISRALLYACDGCTVTKCKNAGLHDFDLKKWYYYITKEAGDTDNKSGSCLTRLRGYNCRKNKIRLPGPS